jgi:CheY-like chemotaxis protein
MTNQENKVVVFLEDNPPGITGLYVSLLRNGVECVLAKSLDDFRRKLQNCNQQGKKIDLLILDDNIYRDKTLQAVGPAVGTESGQITGTQLIKHLKENHPDLLPAVATHKDVPIILYSVHTKQDMEERVGTYKDVYCYEKLRNNIHFEAVEKKVAELLGL